ncbi:hypothetical protein R3P38DRAFT_3321645 [Favolaschia claudopus]|uniref:DUF6589 domain-containing protein n=1 Tax=Favolaschia claudopus TaxID=2862362 RepID=A0AAW0ARW9_9AGAR
MEFNPNTIRKVRSYRRIPSKLTVDIPSFSFNGSASAPATPATATPPFSFVNEIRPRRSKWEKVDEVFLNWGFDSLGEFLQAVFHPHRRGEEDLRTPRHVATVTRFLQGSSAVKLADIIELIYNHPQSRPKLKFPDQINAAFSPDKPLEEIRFAKPCLNAWATRVVGDELYRRTGQLARKNDDPNDRRHLRASTNGRKEGVRVVTWDDTRFTIQGLADRYQEEDGLMWYITECFCAPRVDGKVVVRKRRPHPAIQVAALSSFILSRNSYASGDLALPLGIWHFASQSHVDVKRVYCRLGSTVSDSTARKALDSVSDADSLALVTRVDTAADQGESAGSLVLDNIQYYDLTYEHGIGRGNELKVGTAATFAFYHDAQPGAFDARDHVDRICKEERQNLTTEMIYNDIDWLKHYDISDHHLVRVLAEFSPHLSHMTPQISARFRELLAIHRIPLHKTDLQPLGTNAEQEGTSQGMHQALKDFDQQIGVQPEKFRNILSWVRGDGASHATIMGLKKLLADTPDIYDSLRNVITTPETWHTKATDLNSCASNHYGPAASKDPSSLSRSSNAANMKRPTDLKKCDFYPTSRSMTLIWEARVLDCWRIVLGVDDIHDHFEQLAQIDALPSLDELLLHAAALRRNYASHTAYNQSLSKTEYDSDPDTAIPIGTPKPFAADNITTPAPEKSNAGTGKGKKAPEVHVEAEGFDGDRVLSNSILFIMEFGWWVELNYAIPEGDIGRVLEIFKVRPRLNRRYIYIFSFAGTSNQHYMRYMLELYALLKYECSPALKLTLLNNYLFNLRGELGHSVEGDLTQEWSNKWIIGMAKKRGGEFDEQYFRKTISPNVRHFLQIKEDVESAFDLKRRSKSHTSPHLRDETKILLRMYKEEELHSFCSGRSMGHVAVNRFDRGYARLEGGKLDDFLKKSKDYLMDVDPSTSSLPRNSASSPPNPSSPPPAPTRPASALSNSSTSSSDSSQSSHSTASHVATEQVEEHDPEDRSNEELTSGSDLTVTVDAATGQMSGDWYEEHEFPEALLKMNEEDAESSEEEDELKPTDDVDSEDSGED